MPKHHLQIADYSADLSTGELRHGDRQQRISPKASEILALLCARAGTVVSKQELLEVVWPDTYVNDDSLWHAIAELRQVFDDDPKQPQVIETLPKRGYRLIAEVRWPTKPPIPQIEEPAPEASAQPNESSRPAVPAGRQAVRQLVYSALFVGTLWFAWVALARLYDDAPTQRAPQSLLEQGLAAFERYTAGHNERAIELLEAAVDQQPDDARARAALADAYSFKALNFSVEPWWRDRALEEASRATELDDGLAESHKAMGLAWIANGNRRAARPAYRRAIELRPDYYPAINNLALLESSLGNLAESTEYFARIADANADDEVYLSNYGTALRLLGEHDKAEAVLVAANELPGNVMAASIAWQRALIDLERGAREAARLRLEAALEIAPRDLELLIHSAEIELYLGRRETALALLHRAISARGGPQEIRHFLLLAAAKPEGSKPSWDRLDTNLAEFARSLLQGTEPATAKQHPRRAMDRAMAYLALEEEARALDWLEHTIAAGYRDRSCLRIDPVFESLHGKARFEHLLQRLEELIAAERSR